MPNDQRQHFQVAVGGTDACELGGDVVCSVLRQFHAVGQQKQALQFVTGAAASSIGILAATLGEQALRHLVATMIDNAVAIVARSDQGATSEEMAAEVIARARRSG